MVVVVCVVMVAFLVMDLCVVMVVYLAKDVCVVMVVYLVMNVCVATGFWGKAYLPRVGLTVCVFVAGELVVVVQLAELNLQENCLNVDWMHVVSNVHVIAMGDGVVVARWRLELSLQVDRLGE